MKNQKSALIIGVDGEIGSNLKNHLTNKGWLVYGTTKRLENICSSIFYLNLANYKDFSPNQNFDVVYFCAALTSMAACENDPNYSKLINFDAQAYLCEYFANKASKAIVLSSSAVFDGSRECVPVNADKNPKTVYGKHKAMLEDYLLEKIHNLVIIRPSKVITPQLKLINNWIECLKANLPIFAFNDMNLCPISIYSVTELLEKAGNNITKNKLYQLSGHEDVRYSDLANLLAIKLNRSMDLIHSLSYKDKGINANTVHKFNTLCNKETMTEFDLKIPCLNTILKSVFNL